MGGNGLGLLANRVRIGLMCGFKNLALNTALCWPPPSLSIADGDAVHVMPACGHGFHPLHPALASGWAPLVLPDRAARRPLLPPQPRLLPALHRALARGWPALVLPDVPRAGRCCRQQPT